MVIPLTPVMRYNRVTIPKPSTLLRGGGFFFSRGLYFCTLNYINPFG